MNGLSYSIIDMVHPGQMEDLGYRKVVYGFRKKPLLKAEEVFIIVRELSRDGTFSWKTWYDTCVAVMNPPKYQLQAGFKCTVGNMLRAQVKHKTIVRIGRGEYCFPIPYWARDKHDWKFELPPGLGKVRLLMPRRPLYVEPGRFNMTPGERQGWP